MKLTELPEIYKTYTMILSSGESHQVDGETKQKIMESESRFIQLNDGSCINKSFIIQIQLDKESTRDVCSRLSKAEQESIIGQMMVRE